MQHHGLNGIPVWTVEGLRDAVAEIKPGEPVALLIERDGRLSYLSFDM
jgi:S1-C subfamily serine protease